MTNPTVTKATTMAAATPVAVDVAVLGLGAMGARMAARLIAAGHRVTVWNRTPAASSALARQGARAAATPADAVAGAALVIAMLRDDEASRAVWCDERSGALRGLAANALALESSTVTVDWVRTLAAQVTAAGARFVDAPVVGSRPQADAGQLTYLLGGAAADVERALTVLRALGSAHLHVGGVGSGAALKLVVNALFAAQVAAFAELLPTLAAAGVDRPHAIEVLGQTAVASPAMRGAAAMMLANQHAPLFTVDLVHKDLGYVATGDLPVTRAVRDVFERAREDGMGGLNLTAAARLYG
jgi:3-hydroxyisobutyrate dehydrogenase-like beta-hydroxyacid dehydrogenase